MATNISQFRRGVLSHVIGCPIPAVDAAVVGAVIQLCKDIALFQNTFEHSVDASADVDTSDNDSIEIDLSDYVSDTLRPHIIKELQIDSVPFSISYLDLDNDVDDISTYEIVNTKFFNYPDVGTLKLFPMDTTDDVLVYLKIIWIPLRTMETVDDRIYNDYNQAVEAYAKWFLLSQPRKTWTDIALADYNLSIYSRKMEEAKIDILHGKSFGSMRPKKMRFF